METQTIEKITFDYGQLESETDQKYVLERARTVKKKMLSAARNIWQIGKNLSEARTRLNDAQFILWVRAEFSLSIDSARRFMRVYQTFSETEIAELNIGLNALFELSKDNVPSEVVEEAIHKIGCGDFAGDHHIIDFVRERKGLANDVHLIDESENKPPACSSPPIVNGITVAPHNEVPHYANYDEVLKRKNGQAPAPKAEFKSKFEMMAKFERHLKAVGISYRKFVPHKMGYADLVTPQSVHEFVFKEELRDVYEAIGRLLISRDCIDSKRAAILVLTRDSKGHRMRACLERMGIRIKTV